MPRSPRGRRRTSASWPRTSASPSAKLALQEAFDERDSPAAMRHPVRVDGAQVAAILERLGVD